MTSIYMMGETFQLIYQTDILTHFRILRVWWRHRCQPWDSHDRNLSNYENKTIALHKGSRRQTNHTRCSGFEGLTTTTL